MPRAGDKNVFSVETSTLPIASCNRHLSCSKGGTGATRIWSFGLRGGDYKFVPLGYMHSLVLQPLHPQRLLPTYPWDHKSYLVADGLLFPPLNSDKKRVGSKIRLLFINPPVFLEGAVLLV